MLSVFETVLEMSLTASVVILTVLLARTLLSKAPKKYAYLLWLVVAFRLCIPFSFESSLSIFNTAEVLPSFEVETSTSEAVSDATPDAAPEVSDTVSVPSVPVVPNQGTLSVPEQTPPVDTPVTPPVSGEIPSVPSTPNKPNDTPVETPNDTPVETPNDTPVETPNDTPVEIPDATVPVTPSAPKNDWQNVLGVVLASVWALGIICMLGCGVVSYIKLKKRLQNAVLLYDNVYGSDRIGSPFALGVFRPRIYIPFGLNEEAQGYILAHERYHLKRLDHLVKPLSFLILSVHWFNPLCWLAFNRMSLDMELSCDERVLKQYGDENMKKKYSKTLLDFATDNRYPTPAPISFSEGAGAKTRIKHALYWKKPRFWVSAIAILLCAVVLVACAANAVSNDPSDNSEDEHSDRIIDFGDTPYLFTFESNGDGTCVITDIKTDPDHTEPYDLIIPEKSPDGDKVAEIDLSVLDSYKDVFNVPGALTKETFSSIIGSIRTSEFKGENGITAETAADIADAFYGRPHGQPSAEHVDEFSYVILEPLISVGEASRISEILTNFIGYTAEDCYTDCLAVLELDTSEEIKAILKENAFRFFYHDATNIQKVVLPSEDIKVHQSAAELTFTLSDGTAFEPKYDNPVSIGYLTDDVDLFDPNTRHFAEKQVDASETLMLTTSKTVSQICFFALDSTDGETFSVEKVLLSGVVLTDAQTLVIDTYISETFPNRGIGFCGSDGKMHYYAIHWSGYDGSLFLSEITDRVDFPLTLSIRYATEEDKHNDSYLHFEAAGLTASYDLVIETNQMLASLNVCKFNIADDFSHYTAEPFDTNLGAFSPKTPLHLTVYPESITSTYGISFQDSDGVTRYYAVFESELDGTISLVEITDQVKKQPEQSNGETVIETYEYSGGTLYHAEIEDSYNDRLYLIKDDGTRVDIREQLVFSYLAFSDDQSKLIWNDYEWEWNATVCVYDMASGALTVQPMDDLGISRTPSYMAWLDNRYFLFVSQYDMGTITTGGDLYVYDTETHLYRLLFDVERVGSRELMIHSFATDGQNVTLRADIYDYDADLYVDWTYTVTADSVYELIKYGNSVTLGIDDGELLQKPPQIPNGETLITSFQLEDGYLYHTEDSDHNHVLRIMHYDGTVTEIDKRSYITNVCLNNQKDKLIWNDFAGEYNATVWIYDIDTGDLTERPMDDLGEDYTPSFMSWYDHRYFLFVSQLDHGSIVRGGDVYAYDTQDHTYCKLIDAQGRLMFTSTEESTAGGILFHAVNYNENDDSYTKLSYLITRQEISALLRDKTFTVLSAPENNMFDEPVRVNYAYSDVQVDFYDEEEINKYGMGEIIHTLIFSFDCPVNEFSFIKLDSAEVLTYLGPVDPEQSNLSFEAGDTYIVATYIKDIHDNRGIAFRGKDGEMRYYAIRYNMSNGGAELVEITDQLYV